MKLYPFTFHVAEMSVHVPLLGKNDRNKAGIYISEAIADTTATELGIIESIFCLEDHINQEILGDMRVSLIDSLN